MTEFGYKILFEFWVRLHDHFSTLTERAFAHFCETVCSAVAVLKTKCRNQLYVDRELRLSISNITTLYKPLCFETQTQGSH